jgi:hypothetical protein
MLFGAFILRTRDANILAQIRNSEQPVDCIMGFEEASSYVSQPADIGTSTVRKSACGSCRRWRGNSVLTDLLKPIIDSIGLDIKLSLNLQPMIKQEENEEDRLNIFSGLGAPSDGAWTT